MENLINDLYTVFDHWTDLGANDQEILELKVELLKVLRKHEAEPETSIEDIYTLGREAFGNKKTFLKWCRRENWVLGGKRPINFFDTEKGRARIAQILNTIIYGGVA